MKYLWKLSGIFGIMFGLAAGSPVLAQGGISCALGAQAGYSMASSEISGTWLSVDGLSAKSRSPDFGLRTGCDYRIPTTPFAVGAFADYTWRDVAFQISTPGNAISMGLGSAWTIGGRVMYADLVKGVSPYVGLGYTQTNLNLPAGVNLSSTLKGWKLIGGTEVALAKNLSLGLEGQWTKFDDIDLGAGFAMKPDAMTFMTRLSVVLN